MSTLYERIGACIAASGLNKTAFAKRLGLTQPFVSKLCLGVSQPSDRTIADICREFNINEAWLRTGEGEMCQPVTRDQAITDFMADILKGEPDFRTKLVSVLARLTEEEWQMLERRARDLVSELTETPAPTPQDEPDIPVQDLDDVL